jgi:metal-responsive CopG/Arc/MetJ family transcriptional regulator
MESQRICGDRKMTSAKRPQWKTIQLPEELLKRVDDLVGKPELGYTSRSEFIKEAVRLRVETLETKEREKRA